jgi:hypothetical protein
VSVQVSKYKTIYDSDLKPVVVDVILGREVTYGDAYQVTVMSSGFNDNTWLTIWYDDFKHSAQAALSDSEALRIASALIESVNRKARLK